MPSVGMRRSTRVFGARVLRSGRRLWTAKGNNREEWNELLDNSRDGGGDSTKRKDRGRHGTDVSEKEVTEMDVDKKVVESTSEKVVQEVEVEANHVARRWGNVYTRKRKKVDSSVVDFSTGGNKKRCSDDKRFGKQFYRKKWRKRVTETQFSEASDSSHSLVVPEESLDNSRWQSLLVVVGTSSSSWYSVSCFLSSVLRYMWISRIGLQQLAAFLNTETIVLAYASCGIRFLQGSKLLIQRGACIIWDADTLIPVFSVDYSAVPNCFMSLHSRMLLKFDRLSCSIGQYLVDVVEEDDKMITSTSFLFPGRDQVSEALNIGEVSTIDNSGKIEGSSLNDTASNSVERNLQLRGGHHLQNRKSSLRSKRGRRPSSLGTRKVDGALASSLVSFGHNGTQLSPMTSRRELRSSSLGSAARRNIATNIKHGKSALERVKLEVGATSCSANVLVTDIEKCYRVEGATISLEASAGQQWHLVIKKDGMVPYILVAQKFMRLCGSNRFTHAITWSTTDNDWKLEFPDRQDWLTFKELYKKCADRNAQGPAESFIPVPGVYEVSGYVNISSAFVRPASYIRVKDDELSRALARGTANYDMDSEDEEWLNKFNSEVDAENPDCKHLSAEDFELVIDAFEKGYYINPVDFSDDYTSPQINIILERRVLEAVYRYWIKKRKQRRSALIKVFEEYQRRKSQPISKSKPISNSVFRKKRSFKRQGNLIGRGKQRPLLKAMAAEQDAREQQNALVKVEEAKAAANRSEGLAVLKRQRAQHLMETADLATYKAAMALKIAELAQNGQSPDDVDLDLFFSVK